MKNKFKWIISMFFLVLAPFIAVRHQLMGGGPTGSPSVDALCPFGGLETLSTILKDGTYMQKITPSSFILLIAIIVLTFILGRAFCGYICPLGTIQSLITKIGKKLNIPQIKLNKSVDAVLRYAKYLVLFIVLFTTYKAGELILRPYDPWATFMHLSSGTEIFEEFLIGLIILITILISSLFIERAWCRYFCPLGAALSLTSLLRIFKVKRNSSTCVNCKACTHNCTMGLEIHSQDSTSSIECISCGECITSCPINKTLEMKKGNTSLSINKIGVTVILTLVLIIGGNMAMGNFKTSLSNKNVLNENGALNPDNIKGYMTLNDVSKEFNINTKDLLKACNLPNDTNIDKPIKELKDDLSKKGIEFDPSTLRVIVKEIIK
ncbi:4Fe-4S binding protein [Clostridium sp. MB40-C1]|uniref:4Fe-4S binding protein n=1 Tax=Clostridium sp. MB40-C1 TaxID=3070996 RepID=UPI0027DF803E|nr:4Fe-4S binding protein [Clostridium sp. MB40-C1]WMJ79944.1 4Fe-4S binding protein [Clostridium sp. MB40-C1]